MSAATDSPLGSLPQPPSRAPLRTSSSRTSLGPGVFSPMSSPKSLQRPAGPSPSSSFARLSGTGASSSNSPSNGLGPAPPSGGLSLPGGAGGDLPRLTRASESGVVERNSRNSPSTPGGSLRRSTTISGGARESGGPASLGVTMAAKDGSPSPSGGGPGPGPGGHESAFVVKRERNALLQEKALLLANKRRMDAAIRSLLEQQAEDGTTWAGDGGSAAGGSGGGGGGGGGSPMPAMGGPRPPLTRAAGSVRNLMAKVLEDSANLDKQIAVNGSSGAAILANAEADARVRELTARISELQTEHEVALSRLEGELKYRNTQSSAATSGLQKQLGEAEEEVARLRRQLSLAEGRVREYATSTDLLHHLLLIYND
ncbi:hypothetical protein HXX76_013707 [Chlamydomonas incerta]|uniref:Uncharacterized protein n=1 Tax=Chlamydomonas incerta TaxID=51695 RepID=A0A835SDX6_CHLIN|nr:hypothetical protein HXX76_013707 [Chlamydomonas incerta]|eukprot:KAG2425498.1 hypothetical protein HXX76_013707 [Chlamydomonas incerta]